MAQALCHGLQGAPKGGVCGGARLPSVRCVARAGHCTRSRRSASPGLAGPTVCHPPATPLHPPPRLAAHGLRATACTTVCTTACATACTLRAPLQARFMSLRAPLLFAPLRAPPQARFMSLLGGAFSSLPAALALSIIDPRLNFSEAETQVRRGQRGGGAHCLEGLWKVLRACWGART